jgi:3',5'-cyclic AMP phosphodiesterase CpdA
MSADLALAITADLHWGHRRGQEASQELIAALHARPPDLLVLAGDVGSGPHFADCLSRFDTLSCRKALVPGNHDIWVPGDVPENSLTMYDTLLPRQAAEHGFHYLDQSPLLLPEAGLGLVGTINWYDYSWGIDELKQRFPGEEGRLQSKRFTRGRHNDANFVRWPLDDAGFTARVAGTFEQHLTSALDQVERVIVVTHHPCFLGLTFPWAEGPLELDQVLWHAFSGNRTVEDALKRDGERIAFAFCGHTHRARENTLGPIRGYNIGGDYHFKRLLWLSWPEGAVTARAFGAP